MNRGELWTVAGGVYASKPRPALIIQDNHYEATDSVTVLPLTTAEVDAPLLRLSVPPTGATGLERPSFIMIDKLTTVRRSSVLNHLGRLSSAKMLDVERALLVFLGLAD